MVEPVEGTLYNVFNTRDYILRYLFRLAQLNTKSPCGLKPILFNHPKIMNIDATQEISPSPRNHWEHLEALPNTIGWLFDGGNSVVITEAPFSRIPQPRNRRTLK
jgi:hypothetical protein